MGEEDVLVEVLINGRDILQFFSTPEHYKTLFEDRDALINTVKTAFKDGVLSSEDIKDVEDIHSVRFLNEVSTESVEVTTEEGQVAEDYEEYEIIEEASIETLTSSALPEELIIDVGLSSGVPQNGEGIKSSNSGEGVLENERTEILNNDSSNSDPLQEDKIEENYINQNDGEGLLECDDGAEIQKEVVEEQSYGQGHSTYIHEQSNIAEDQLNDTVVESVNDNDTETVEVVSEEHVITTPMEEGEYEINEEEYSEGGIANSSIENSTEDSVSEQARKSKNLSFLNKSQAEKLKEFKRLLQQGTQHTQNETNSHRLQLEESARQICSSEYDNISENTESCNEDPAIEEDFQETSAVAEESMTGDERSSGEKPESQSNLASFESAAAPPGEAENINDVEEPSSILIVERSEDGFANNGEEGEEYEEVVYEEVLEEGEGEKSVHMCELCGFEADSLSDLKTHIGIHTGETTSLFYCDECSFRSYRKPDISRHKTLFHGASPPQRLSFVCGVCGYRTASKEEFFQHGESHKMDSFKCKICELKLNSQEELKVHNRKHIGEEPFECYHCAYLTARKCHLRKHMRRHAIGTLGGKGPPYECYTCGFQTGHRTNFHKHIGTHKVERTITYTCHYCRFVTLDETVYKNHLSMHSDGERNDKSTSVRNVSMEVDKTADSNMSMTNGEMKKGRTPLKEWFINVPDLEEKEVENKYSKTLAELKKHKLKDEYYTCTPLKRRRRSLKSFINNSGASVVEQRLARKFNFNIKNLCQSKDVNSGFSVDFCGEVLKSHGCLRKYTSYGDIVSKNDTQFGTVLANINNEKHLRPIYEKLKETMMSMKKSDIEENSSFQFTLYFKELDDVSSKSLDESLSDLDLSISSDNDSDENSLNDLDSDLDLDVGPSNDDVSSLLDNKDSIKKIKVEKKRKNGSKNSNSEFIFNLDAADKVKFLQQKIRERNERMKELRRLKILNVSSRQINPIRPKREPISVGLERES